MNELNQEELNQAARYYCQAMGWNPDEQVGCDPAPDENGVVLAMLIYRPRWELCVDTIKRHNAVKMAIEHAMTDRFFKTGASARSEVKI